MLGRGYETFRWNVRFRSKADIGVHSLMSAKGQMRTRAVQHRMYALPLKADIATPPCPPQNTRRCSCLRSLRDDVPKLVMRTFYVRADRSVRSAEQASVFLGLLLQARDLCSRVSTKTAQSRARPLSACRRNRLSAVGVHRLSWSAATRLAETGTEFWH